MSSALWTAMPVALILAATVAAFLLYVHLRYTSIVARIFEEKPLFLPLRITPADDGDEVRFPTPDGLTLAGTYLRSTAGRRLGVVVFCHEYLGDRWSALAYAAHLRDLGFDLFTFDFRNHGQSDVHPSYRPLQWVTEHEVYDLRGALNYLRGRPDADPAGVGLFGVSRGGGTALCVGGKDVGVWGVVTDGAFPTRGTMLAYVRRWAEIYVGSKLLWERMPHAVYEFLCWTARKRSQARLHCRFPDVERATSRLAPRPLLMIHGEKDAYIGPAIARSLFAQADEPKELWLVPKAKHNRSCQVAGPLYLDRVAGFFLGSAPRRSTTSAPGATTSAIRAVATSGASRGESLAPVASAADALSR